MLLSILCWLFPSVRYTKARVDDAERSAAAAMERSTVFENENEWLRDQLIQAFEERKAASERADAALRSLANLGIQLKWPTAGVPYPDDFHLPARVSEGEGLEPIPSLRSFPQDEVRRGNRQFSEQFKAALGVRTAE